MAFSAVNTTVSTELLSQVTTFLSSTLANNDLHLNSANATLSKESFEILIKRMEETMEYNELLSKHKSSIKQLPNGRWYTRLDGHKVERKSRKDLENLVVKHYKEKYLTILSLYDGYLERRKLTVADTTWQKDVRYFNMFLKNSEVANIPLTDLKLSDGYNFLQYCFKVKPNMKYKYWKGLWGCVNQMLKFAVEEGHIDKNPFANLTPKKDLFTPATVTRDGDSIFSESEKSKVCSLAIADAKNSKRAEPLGIILLFNLGLRDGELCALKWGDIEDYHQGKKIHIQRQMVANIDDSGKAHGFKILNHCKTPAGNRRLQLNTKSLEALQLIKAYNTANNIPTNNDDYIFLRNTKEGILNCTPRSFDPRLRKYCRKAGMEVIKSPHDIRRTVITNLCRLRMPLKEIQEFAGHSSLKQTMDYLRISDDDSDLKQFLEAL